MIAHPPWLWTSTIRLSSFAKALRTMCKILPRETWRKRVCQNEMVQKIQAATLRISKYEQGGRRRSWLSKSELEPLSNILPLGRSQDWQLSFWLTIELTCQSLTPFQLQRLLPKPLVKIGKVSTMRRQGKTEINGGLLVVIAINNLNWFKAAS
jgi:hypothetical protein